MRDPLLPQAVFSLVVALGLAPSSGCAVAGIHAPPDADAQVGGEVVGQVAIRADAAVGSDTAAPPVGAAGPALEGATTGFDGSGTSGPGAADASTTPAVGADASMADGGAPVPTTTGGALTTGTTSGGAAPGGDPTDPTGGDTVATTAGDATAGSSGSSSAGANDASASDAMDAGAPASGSGTFSADMNTCDPSQCECLILTPCCNARDECGCGFVAAACIY